jgi:hypothetical protein
MSFALRNFPDGTSIPSIRHASTATAGRSTPVVVSSRLAPVHWASAKARVKGGAVSAVRARAVLDAVTVPGFRTGPARRQALGQNETRALAAPAQRGSRC